MFRFAVGTSPPPRRRRRGQAPGLGARRPIVSTIRAITAMVVAWALSLPAAEAVVITAMVPVVELRGAIPLGVALGLPPLKAAILGVVGSLIPVPFILAGFEPVSRALRRRVRLQGLIEWTYRRSRARSGSVRQYGWLGLVLLVAVPLPGTGAWTGALVASFLGYSFRPALLAIVAGTLIAGSLVLLLVMTGMIVAGS